MFQNTQIEDLQAQINKLKVDLDNLNQSFFKNNFSSSQTFTKDAIFNTRLKIPHFSSAPSVCEVGDIIEIGGIMYICTVANTTWTVVGTQY